MRGRPSFRTSFFHKISRLLVVEVWGNNFRARAKNWSFCSLQKAFFLVSKWPRDLWKDWELKRNLRNIWKIWWDFRYTLVYIFIFLSLDSNSTKFILIQNYFVIHLPRASNSWSDLFYANHHTQQSPVPLFVSCHNNQIFNHPFWTVDIFFRV